MADKSAEKIPNYQAPNGLHVLFLHKRVLETGQNPGEVAGFEPAVAEKIIKDHGGEYAVRVKMLKDAPHWQPKHNPPMKAGSIQGVSRDFSLVLINKGDAKLADADDDAGDQLTREQADSEHIQKIAASTARMMGAAPAAAASKR